MKKNIFERIFVEGEREIIGLMEDKYCSKAILKQTAKEILDSDEILIRFPDEQLIALAMTGIKSKEGKGFAEENEAYFVGNAFCRQLKSKEILPFFFNYYADARDFYSSSSARGSLGEKCLVSLSLFYTQMQQRTKRYSSPSVLFYEEIGKVEFEKKGMHEISKHFNLWINLFGKQFSASNKKFKKAFEKKYLINKEK